MPSLYEQLHVKTTATKEEIEKNYRVLYCKYNSDDDSKELVRLNNARRILMDPYQRSFYDMFGAGSLQILQSPIQGYFYPRLFTRMNIICISVYVVMNIINLSGYFFFFLGFRSYLFKNMLLVFSGIFPITICVNIYASMGIYDGQARKIFYIFMHLLFNLFEIAIIALYYDGHFPGLLAAVNVLLLEACVTLCYAIRAGDSIREGGRELVFRISKALLLCLYFIPGLCLRIWIPTTIIFVSAVLVHPLLFFLGAFVTAYTLSLYATLEPKPLNFLAFLSMLCFNSLVCIALIIAVAWFKSLFLRPASLFDRLKRLPFLPLPNKGYERVQFV